MPRKTAEDRIRVRALASMSHVLLPWLVELEDNRRARLVKAKCLGKAAERAAVCRLGCCLRETIPTMTSTEKWPTRAGADADHRSKRIDENVSRRPEEAGLSGGGARSVPPPIQGSAGGPTRQLHHRTRRDGRFSRPQRRGQDDD